MEVKGKTKKPGKGLADRDRLHYNGDVGPRLRPCAPDKADQVKWLRIPGAEVL